MRNRDRKVFAVIDRTRIASDDLDKLFEVLASAVARTDAGWSRADHRAGIVGPRGRDLGGESARDRIDFLFTCRADRPARIFRDRARRQQAEEHR